MLFESLSWVMLTLTLLVALPGALASSPPKRSKKSTATRPVGQIYPAMEDGGEPLDLNDEVATVTSSTPKKKNKRVQTLGAAAPAAYVATTPATKFEVVPADKRAQILKRMELCQSLFQESGRAYDYREMTTAELQKELNAVRAGERPVATRDAAGVKPSMEVPVNAVPTDGGDPILDSSAQE